MTSMRISLSSSSKRHSSTRSAFSLKRLKFVPRPFQLGRAMRDLEGIAPGLDPKLRPLFLEQVAILKARAVSKATGLIALADDSGLEVAALGGRPGVRSARFAHERATDAENNAALLRELEEVGEVERSAGFRCVLALVTPWDDVARTVEGACSGQILRAPRGSGGFGYDPLFFSEELGMTFAEARLDEKARVSHRARAAAALLPRLAAHLKVAKHPASR